MKLFDIADAYLRESDWRDLALVKFCLCAMGVLIGLCLPKRAHKPVALLAMLVFLLTYIPLMLKFFMVAKGYTSEIEI